MEGKVSAFLPSHNKREYVLDALRCVQAQTYQNWELWILENSTDGYTRQLIENWIAESGLDGHPDLHYERIDNPPRASVYVTAWLLNNYYNEATGDYIFFLADDDLIDPDCFEKMAGELNSHPDYDVVWAGLRSTGCKGPGDTGPFMNAGIEANHVKEISGSVDCRIDGGQVMHRKSCLDAITWPWFEETTEFHVARHCDGLFMERFIAAGIKFYPVNEWLITHRFTPISTMTKQGNT